MLKAVLYISNRYGRNESVYFDIEELRHAQDHCRYKIKGFSHRALSCMKESVFCGVTFTMGVFVQGKPDLFAAESVSPSFLLQEQETLFLGFAHFAMMEAKRFENRQEKAVLYAKERIIK